MAEPAGKRVRVGRNDYELLEIDESELPKALERGYVVVDDVELEARAKRREAASASGLARGTAEAAARGLTLGGSDLLATEVFGADAEEMALRQEATGVLGTTAEVAGALLPTIGTGGAGLGARATTGLGRASLAVPTRGLARLGAGVERGVAEAVGSRGAGMVARGAVEGVGAGVGAELSDAALLDRDLTAEAVLGGGAMGGLLGGGIGVGISGGMALLGAAGRATKGALRRTLGGATGVAEASDEAVAAFERAGQSTPGEAWLDTYADAMGIDRASMREAYGLTKTQRGRDLLFRDLNEVRGEIATAGKSAIDDFNSARTAVRDAITGRNKLEKIESLLDDVDSVAVREQSAGVLARARQHIDDALAKPDAGTSYIANDLRAAQGWFKRAEREIATSLDRPEVATFRAMERLKQDIDNLVAKRRKAAKGTVSPQLDDTISILRRVTSGGVDDFTGEAVDGIRPFLESSVWGRAGELQRAQNAAISGEFRAIDALREKSPQLARMFDIGSEVDEAAVLNFVRSFTKAGGKTKANLVDDVLKAREKAIKVARENYDLDPDALSRLAKSEKSITDLRARLTDLAETADASEVMQRIRRAAGGGSPSITTLTTLGPTVGGLLGSTFGPLGAAAGYIAGRAADPFNTLRTIAALRTTAERFGVRLDGVAKKITQQVRPRARRRPSGTVTPAVAFRSMSRSERDERADKAKESAALFASRPELLAEAIARQTREIATDAPTIAAGVQDVAQRAAVFLQSRIPASLTIPLSSLPPLVDPLSAAKWGRYVEAVTDPFGALDRVDDGTLTVEHVEAIQAVYPRLYQDLRQRVEQEILEAEADGDPVPLDARQRIGILLGTPTTPGLVLGTTVAIQDAIAGQAEQAEQVGPMNRGGIRQAKIDTTSTLTSHGRMAAGVDRS